MRYFCARNKATTQKSLVNDYTNSNRNFSSFIHISSEIHSFIAHGIPMNHLYCQTQSSSETVIGSLHKCVFGFQHCVYFHSRFSTNIDERQFPSRYFHTESQRISAFNHSFSCGRFSTYCITALSMYDVSLSERISMRLDCSILNDFDFFLF